MNFQSFLGKWRQLRNASPKSYLHFISGWRNRSKNGFVPCVIPGCRNLLYVPLSDFYESYSFFCEHPGGRKEFAFFLSKIISNDVLYDIGGFRAAYSAAVKAKWKDKISVHIFEPIARNADAIRRIGKLNDFKFSVNQTAVSDGGQVVGSVNEQDAMLRLGDEKATVACEFPSLSIDQYISKGNPPPTIVKLDVDGYELKVLQGMKQCLITNHPRLWIEIHPGFFTAQNISTDVLSSLLDEAGYKISFFEDYHPKSNLPYHIWCE